MKYFNSLLSLFVIGLLIAGLLYFKELPFYDYLKAQTSNITAFVSQFFRSKKHNISLELGSERKPPITLLDKKVKLKGFLYSSSQTFQRYDDQDWAEFWHDFWNQIYQPISEGQFNTKRYKSKEEIKAYLVQNYPDPFIRFQKPHWNYFWSIVFSQ